MSDTAYGKFYINEDGHARAELPKEIDPNGLINDFLRVDTQTNRFSLYQGADLCFETLYVQPQIDPPRHLDPTPFVGEEDDDYYLFVYNVLNDAKRRHEIYR